ncbi:MAG: outer membrane protein assembly factor BamA [Campylobacterales bacterium]|nr:outer membrane protein assembly factor BamA [Campylobacterales bacterium]
MLKKVSIACLVLGSFAFAEQLRQIKFEGLNTLSDKTATDISGLKIGENITNDKITESIKNFYEQGYFKDVWVEKPSSGILVFHFDEKLAISNVEINGYGSGDDATRLLESAGVKKGDFYDSKKIQVAKQSIIASVQSEGFYDTVVEVTTTPVSDSSVSVTFDVNKGEKIKIKKLNLNGAKELDASDFDELLANKEQDFLGWLPLRNSGVANVEQLELDPLRVKDVYMRKGFLDAEVSKPFMRVDFSSYEAEIDYNIVEGEQYKVGQVVVSGTPSGVNIKDMKDDFKLNEGKTFNIEKMRKDIANIKEEVGNLGYAFAEVSPQINKDQEKKIVNISYIVTPGSKVTINDVIIAGNDTTKDRVVRRYVYLAPGDTYKYSDLKDSKNALGRTGFFEKYDVKSQRVSEDKMDIIVDVKEAPTGSISLGGGYGSYEGFMVNGSVSDRNIFGTGIAASVSADLSKISTNFSLNFTNPRLWDSEYSLGVNLFKRDYEYTNYDLDQFGGSLTLGRQLFRNLYISTGISYIDNESEANSDSTSYTYKLLYSDKYEKLSGLLGITFDNTDDYYVPREGFIASANLEYAMIDGDIDAGKATEYGYSDFSDFAKLSLKFGAYYGLEDLIDYDLILRYKARYTLLEAADDDKYVPIAERLYLGGIGSVRGYDAYSISPIYYDTDSVANRVGGTQTFSNSIEASIPISEEAKMRLTFFADYGIVKSDHFIEDFDTIDKSSVGAAIEWNSPFGPINFVFAKAISPEPEDDTSSFEFTMGTKF